MARLSEDTIREIVEMIEEELYSVRSLDRIEKMKMKTKIRHQTKWLMMILNPKPNIVLERMKKKMPELFSLLPYGFTEDFEEFLVEKMKDLKKKKRYS